MNLTLTKIEGTFRPDINFALSTLPNGVYNVKITRKARRRSVSQNALMWMWWKCLEDATGTPSQDWHDYFKSLFLARHATIGGREVVLPGTTANLNSVQFTAYLEKVRAHCAAEWGVRLPDPDDPHIDDFIDTYWGRINN